jgi:kynurenine formamidase
MLSTDQTLKGLGLVIVPALGCRLVAGRVRLPVARSYFLFVAAPLRIVRGTGSPLNPPAIF